MKRIRLFVAGLLLSSNVCISNNTDIGVPSYDLDEVVIESQSSVSPLKSIGDETNIDLRSIENLPRFMGEVDPIRYLQTLPGVLTNNELYSGISIHGCDDYQNYVSINNAPIYYPNHLLGLSSTFIAEHFSTLNLEKSKHDASFADRLGGGVYLRTITGGFGKWFTNANISLIESNVTSGFEVSKGHNVVFSVRASYITLLYGKYLSRDDTSFGYNFQDANLTYSYNNYSNDVTVSFFFNRDRFSLNGTAAHIKGALLWGNLMSVVNWEHRFEKGVLQTDFHFSGFKSHLNAGDYGTNVSTDGNMASFGSVSRYSDSVKAGGSYCVGVEYLHQMALPLNVITENLTQNELRTNEQNSDEIALFADWRQNVFNWFEYSVGVRGTCFINQSKTFLNLSPRVSFTFRLGGNHKISLHYGYYNQYLHKAGLTNGGLPTDFYFLSDDKFVPEASHSASVCYNYNLSGGKFGISVELYFKQLYNVITAKSDVFKLISNGFNYIDDIHSGNGRNYGFDVMFAKQTGIVTGYVSYSFSRALRMFPSLGYTKYTCPANHERVHNLKLVVSARFKKRWTVGMEFVLCSGTPYTRAECVYLLNGTAVVKYGEYNAARLPLYNRLDLSGGCDVVKNDKMQLTLNISLFNVYAYKNIQYYVYNDNLKEYGGTFLGTIIPSFCVSMKF